MIDLTNAVWRKATRSNGANTGCVEVATNLVGAAAVRDSVRPQDGAHVLHPAAFRAFLTSLKSGTYDLP